MTAPTPIPPALSKEEWEERCYQDGDDQDPDGIVVDIQGDNILSIETHDQPTDPQEAWRLRDRIDPRRRHALAAFCLYGQSFGFTQEDVQLLLGQADVEALEARRLRFDAASSASRRLLRVPKLQWAEEYEACEQHYRSLAARISALLPPIE